MSDNDEREELKSIRKSLKKVLSKSRYEHTLVVEFTSAALAMCYGADIKKAGLAGLLHDCAKQERLSPDDMISICRKYHIEISRHCCTVNWVPIFATAYIIFLIRK